ncbi:hypothetical protein DL93DRAFT_502926 [Clavulina sp. PMI_390]|nr:hypothetical protein DL93DRAFT_502926 [Clavulina sp. PMI_390]
MTLPTAASEGIDTTKVITAVGAGIIGVALAPVAAPAMLAMAGFTAHGVVAGTLFYSISGCGPQKLVLNVSYLFPMSGSLAAGLTHVAGASTLIAGAQAVVAGGSLPVVGSVIAGGVSSVGAYFATPTTGESHEGNSTATPASPHSEDREQEGVSDSKAALKDAVNESNDPEMPPLPPYSPSASSTNASNPPTGTIDLGAAIASGVSNLGVLIASAAAGAASSAASMTAPLDPMSSARAATPLSEAATEAETPLLDQAAPASSPTSSTIIPADVLQDFSSVVNTGFSTAQSIIASIPATSASTTATAQRALSTARSRFSWGLAMVGTFLAPLPESMSPSSSSNQQDGAGMMFDAGSPFLGSFVVSSEPVSMESGGRSDLTAGDGESNPVTRPTTTTTTTTADTSYLDTTTAHTECLSPAVEQQVVIGPPPSLAQEPLD